MKINETILKVIKSNNNMNNYQIEGEQRNATTHIALFTINAMQ